MTHTFRIDEGTAAMVSHAHADGSYLEIDCRAPDGKDVRLRLEFTNDGMERFSAMVAKFVRTTQRTQEAAAPGPAAAPTTGTANANQRRHIERYTIVCLRDSEVERLRTAVQPYHEDGPRAGAYQGDERVVLWRVPDPRVQDPDDPGYRVYMSPGALRAAAEEGRSLEVVGEISRRELPKQRDLLMGDPALDWQDTTTPVQV